MRGGLSINMDKWHLWVNTPGIKALFMGVNRGALDWTLYIALDKKGKVYYHIL